MGVECLCSVTLFLPARRLDVGTEPRQFPLKEEGGRRKEVYKPILVNVLPRQLPLQVNHVKHVAHVARVAHVTCAARVEYRVLMRTCVC